MRSFRRALLAAGLGFAVSCVIAACGGGAGLLSGDQANSLNSQLNQISADITAGHCRAAVAAARSLQDQVVALPSTVQTRLRQDLDLGAVTVSQLAGSQCHQVSVPTTSTPTTTDTTPTSTNTTPTTTNTTPTTTQTTTTSATTTTTTGTNTGPSGGGGLGNGNGSGNGSGGGSGNGSGGGTQGGTGSGGGNGGNNG